MFKDEYRKEMSFPVSEELLERTARAMRRQKGKGTPARRVSYSKLATAAAAAFLLVVGLTAGSLSLNGNASNDAAPRMGAMAGGEVAMARDSGGGGEAFDSSEPDEGIERQSDDMAPLLYSALPPAESVSVGFPLTGVEKETALPARSADELKNSGNPWNEKDAPEVLPVYLNTVAAGEEAPDESELHSRAASIVEALGESVGESYTVESGSSVACTLGNVTVTNTGEAAVVFDSAETVQAASLEEAAASFYGQYAFLLDIERPAFSTSLRYTGDGGPVWTAAVYEDAGTVTERILSFNLERADFEITAEGDRYTLTSLRFRTDRTEESAGEYQLLGVGEARERLLAGDYETGAELQGPLEEQAVQSVELLYWTDAGADYWLPVYRFLVELSEVGKEGLQAYAACYVPACTTG